MKPLALLATLFTAVRGLLPALVVLALLLSACVAKLYEGPERPHSEIATIDRWHSHDWVVLMMGILPIPVSARHETNVFNIDGKRESGYRFHVLPGQHIVDVRYARKPYVALMVGPAVLPFLVAFAEVALSQFDGLVGPPQGFFVDFAPGLQKPF